MSLQGGMLVLDPEACNTHGGPETTELATEIEGSVEAWSDVSGGLSEVEECGSFAEMRTGIIMN